jgi:hypothetical protein
MKLSLVVLVVVSLFAFTLASGHPQGGIQTQRVSPAVVADGNPAPPFPPKPDASVTSDASWVMADGNPAPPFPPTPETAPNLQAAWLIADGNPAPPFPPSEALPVTA